MNCAPFRWRRLRVANGGNLLGVGVGVDEQRAPARLLAEETLRRRRREEALLPVREALAVPGPEIDNFFSEARVSNVVT